MDANKKTVARPRKVAKKAAAKSRPVTREPVNPWDGMLDTGDRVEVGATMELKDRRGRSYWPKVSVSVQKRAGEAEDQTVARASQVAHGALEVHATEFLSGD